MNSKRKVNNGILNEFGNLKEIELSKNLDGIYDIKGIIHGRKFEIKHLTGVWASPRKATIKLQHRIHGLKDSMKFGSAIITPKIFRKNLFDWPERNLKNINKIIDSLTIIEKDPNLLSTSDPDSLKLMFA
jgi:hypothetical protein